jgi:hypothetical protein
MHGNFSKNVKEFKFCVTDLKDKMNKLLKMCDSTDFKQNEAFETLQDGLVNLLEIKCLNSEVQKVSLYYSKIRNWRILKSKPLRKEKRQKRKI